jgi:hypothetical protein
MLDRGADVLDLVLSVFVLARRPAAFAVVTMIDGKRGEAARRQRLCVDARHLFLDAGHRAGDHQCGVRAARRGRIEVADDALAGDLELDAATLYHGGHGRRHRACAFPRQLGTYG